MEKFKKSLFLHSITHNKSTKENNNGTISIGPKDYIDERSQLTKNIDNIMDKTLLIIAFIVLLPITLPIAILQNIGILFGTLYDRLTGEHKRTPKYNKI